MFKIILANFSSINYHLCLCILQSFPYLFHTLIYKDSKIVNSPNSCLEIKHKACWLIYNTVLWKSVFRTFVKKSKSN